MKPERERDRFCARHAKVTSSRASKNVHSLLSGGKAFIARFHEEVVIVLCRASLTG
jgi:hypothetical protein